MGQKSLFDRLEWFQRTLEHTPDLGRPLVIRARAEGSDCWFFLMQRQTHAVALASWYTLAFRPVFTGAPSAATQFALLIAVARRLAKHVSRLTLWPMPTEIAALVLRAFDRARWIGWSRRSTVSWTVDTQDYSFDEYWAARPGELRSTVKRKAAKCALETRVYEHFDAAAWAEYEAVYAASWKPDEGAMTFLRALAMAEGEAGTLRLGIAHIDAQAVAAQLWTVENGTAIIHKLAHLESAKEYSPGSLLSAAMFAHVIDHDRVAMIDFGTGDDHYKADWMDTRSTLHSVELYNMRHLSGLAGAAKAALRALVPRVRSR